MSNVFRIVTRPLLLILLFASAARAADERTFREGRFERGELKYIGGLPVLTVEGTPQEIGRQRAALIGEAAKAIAEYPKKLMGLMGRQDDWQGLLVQARAMLPQFPPPYREELAAFTASAGIDADLGLLGNTVMDFRGGLACSSLIVEPGKSATKGPLFGRNLDFFTLGLLDKCSLVTVHRPGGKHAVASVGFPGLLGCLSGMNDAGLCLAVHEVFSGADGARRFNPKGVPYTLTFRRVLEECATIEEAEKLIRSTERTTMLSLAVCDRRGGAVIELTPKTVAVRRGTDGLCACTNHFRTPELSLRQTCRRYTALRGMSELKTVTVADIARKLDEVNLGRMTVQTMVFEPDPLVLHLAIGACPTSKLPLQRLPLAELLGRKAPGR